MNDPTTAMKARVEAWLTVLNHVETYLKAASERYDGIFEATQRLSREMPQPTSLDAQFAPVGKGGIQDLFVKLWSDLNLPDGNAAENASNVIKNELLTDLKLLRTDLNTTYKDYQTTNFNGDKLTPVQTRDPQIQKKINLYTKSINAAELGKQPETDPYILKLELDKEIKRKTSKQNDDNCFLQDTAKSLDAEVTQRLQNILKKYTDIVEQNAHIIAKGAQDARSVFINQPKLFEYKHWLTKAAAPKTLQVNKVGEIEYPNMNSNYAKALRVGTLERRSKIIHTYSAGEYVLTPLSLIEIRQNQVVWACDLVGAKLVKDHKAAFDNDQFVLMAKQHGSKSGKEHTFVFRAKVASNWVRDLENVLNREGGVPLSSYESARQSLTPAISPAPAYEPPSSPRTE